MSKIDQFESAFAAAAKPRYRHEGVEVKRVVVFTDLDPAPCEVWGDAVRAFLGSVTGAEDAAFRVVPGRQCDTIGEVLAIVAKEAPDLVVTYRNLHSQAWQWPHSLSDHLEVLTQVADAPVLLLPRPAPDGRWTRERPRAVMALTDHLAGDDSLVRWSTAFAATGGRLFLTHVEDDATFERYMKVISKIPDLNSDVARDRIKKQLLKEPRDYISSVASVLATEVPDLAVEAEVLMGHRLAVYKDLVERLGVDLLVLHTKDEDQLAMHGISYPLAVELRDVPMLML